MDIAVDICYASCANKMILKFSQMTYTCKWHGDEAVIYTSSLQS